MSISKYLRNNSYLYLLFLQISIFLFCNALWIKSSFFQLCAQPDSQINVSYCLELLGICIYDDCLPPYQPLLHYLTLPLLKALGLNQWPFFIIQSIFAIIWIIATYMLGKEWFNPNVGFWASSLLLWSVQTDIMVRNYLLDYPAAALITLQLYFLFRSRNFTDKLFYFLFLLLIPIVVGIKSHHILCLAPILLTISILLFKFDSEKLCSTKSPKIAIIIISQLLGPTSLTIVGLALHLQIVDVLMLFCAGTIIASSIMAIKLRNNSKETRYATFLRYQIGVAVTTLVTIFLYTKILVYGDLSLHIINNIGIPSLYNGELLTSILQIGRWCLGHIIEIKTKNLQPLPFYLYFIGLIVAICRPKYVKDGILLICPTIFTSILTSLCTYDSVRYQAPLLSLRLIIAVFWIQYIPPKLRLIRVIAHIVIILSVLSGVIFNSAWIIKSKIPHINANMIFKDFHLSNGKGDSFNFDQYDQAYDPMIRYNYTISLAAYRERLYNFYSVYSSNLFFTCDTYDINWAECAKGIRRAMDRPQDSAYLLLDPLEISDMMSDRKDNIITNLNLSYKVSTSSSDYPILPYYESSKEKKYIAVAIPPNSSTSPYKYIGDKEAKIIYSWSCPELDIHLFKFY